MRPKIAVSSSRHLMLMSSRLLYVLWLLSLLLVVMGSLLPATSPVMRAVGRLPVSSKLLHFCAYACRLPKSATGRDGLAGARHFARDARGRKAARQQQAAALLRLRLAGPAGAPGHQAPVSRRPSGPRHDTAGRGIGVWSEAGAWPGVRNPRHVHQRSRRPYRLCNRHPEPPYRPGSQQQLTFQFALSRPRPLNPLLLPRGDPRHRRWKQVPPLRRPLPFAGRRPVLPAVSPPAEPIPDKRHRKRTAGERGPAGGPRFRQETGPLGVEAAKGSAEERRCRIP